MGAIMLYYCKFTKNLTSIGFEINPYYPWVANKVIESSQMTIWFHIDDCKMSHHERKASDCMIKWLRQEYKIIFEDGSGNISVSQGKVHGYLEINLYYTVCGQVGITMCSYIE